MRRSLMAAVSALAMLATPALAQTSGSDAAAPASRTVAQAAEPPVPAGQAATLLGKPVKLAGGDRQVGQIAEVMVREGEVSNVVVEFTEPKHAPIMVKMAMLSPDGQSYVLDMTEEELSAVTPPEPNPGASSSGD